MGTPVVRPPAAPLVVECPVCKVPLKSQQALEYHASKKNACVPPGIPKHHCVVCDKSFKVAAGLRQHQQGQRHLKKAAGVEAEERLRKAARENAQEAARLESVLAAGCGVCGIERFSRECIMLVHNQSHKHAAAVEEAALKAVAAAAAAAATAEIDDCPSSSSNDLAGSGDNIMTGEGPEKHQTFEHDLDEIYQDLGYSRKDEIVRSLQSHYTEGVDFIKTVCPKNWRHPNPRHTYHLTTGCLHLLIARCRSRKIGRESRTCLIANVRFTHIRRYTPKEEETIGFIYTVLNRKYKCHLQWRFHTFRADMYVEGENLIIECDENGHASYDKEHEERRLEAVKARGLTCYRFNPDEANFCLATVVADLLDILSS